MHTYNRLYYNLLHTMTKFKKWIYRYDNNGFINKEHEKLEKYFMFGAATIIGVSLIALVTWVIIEE